MLLGGLSALASGTVIKSSDINRPNLQSTTSMVIAANTELTENITTGNFTVDPGVLLTSNGFSILCTGNFTNYGTISTGTSAVENYTLSYGGSGGGAYQEGHSTILRTSGYSTRAPGGSGNSKPDSMAGNGTTPMSPVLSSSLIASWYTSGIRNYLSGAAGDYLPAHNYMIGYGSNGLYIQAYNLVNRGVIRATGDTLNYGQNGYYPGGGGGGVVLLAYGNSLVSGVIQVNGETGAYDTNLTYRGGTGGSGQVLEFHYRTEAPVSSFKATRINLPQWAFAGAYLNYSVTLNYNGNQTNSYDYIKINAVYPENQTFLFSEYSGKINGPRTSLIKNEDESYFYPTYFTALSQQVLGQLNENVTTGIAIELGLPSTNITVVGKDLRISVGAGTFNTIEVSYGNGRIWIDPNTGIFVKDSFTTSLSTVNVSFVSTLNSTNIVAHSAPLNLFLIILPIIAGIIVVGVSARLYGASDGRRQEIHGLDHNLKLNAVDNRNAIEARLTELKSMLDNGLITQEYYMESVTRLNQDRWDPPEQ